MGLIDTAPEFAVDQYAGTVEAGNQYIVGPTQRPIRLQYFEGNEWNYASRGQEEILTYQDKLVRSGLLKRYIRGEWDLDSANAMRVVMRMANFNELTVDQVLDRILAAGGLKTADGGQGGQGGGLGTPQLTDDDIRMVANKTAQGLLGRNLREDEISGFIPAFRGSVASGTSAAAAGETVLRQQVAPTETAAYGLGTAMQKIGAVLEGGGQ
jgi:hypothetical protein